MVEKKEVEKAVEILRRLKNEQQAKIACPNCASHNVELVSTPRKASTWLTAISTFILGDYAVAVDKVNHCFDCGHEFPEEKTND